MDEKRKRKSSNSSENEDYSLIRQCREVFHVPLPPSYIGSERKGVKELLNGWTGQYVRRLHGVVLGHKNVALEDRSGSIIDDQPFVHFDVTADFKVFSPKPGCLVQGKINRMSKGLLGCLVHDWVNVTIHVPPNPSPELSRYLHMGQEVLCKILSIALYKGAAVRLRASITKEWYVVELENGRDHEELLGCS